MSENNLIGADDDRLAEKVKLGNNERSSHPQSTEVSMGRKARLDLVLDCAEPQGLAEFWRDALGYRVHYSSGAHVILVPNDDSNASPLVLQQVPEPRSGKNRMHIDLVTDDIEGEVTRLLELGARRLHVGVQSIGDVRWVTLADPVDNVFCVCTGVEW